MNPRWGMGGITGVVDPDRSVCFLRMGGSISLDSEEGVGTRVNITLRVAQGQGAETADDSSFSFTKRPSPVEPAACVPSAKAGIAGGLCLVVDDNSFNRDVMHSMLSVLGHRVRLATNGLEALDRSTP